MQTATYSEQVTVEEVKFSDEEKKRLQKGEVGFGESIRINGQGKEATFSQHRAINNQGTVVEEGQFIVHFADGTQRLLSAEEAKESLSGMKEVKHAKAPKAKAEVDDSTLASRAAANKQPLDAQSNAEARVAAEAGQPAAQAAAAAKEA